MRKKCESYTCPVCGAILYPFEFLFVNMGDVVGCENCRHENKVEFDETMLVQELIDQGYTAYIDHKIDDIKESK